MKVKELIEQLSKMDQDSVVVLRNELDESSDGFDTIDSVDSIKVKEAFSSSSFTSSDCKKDTSAVYLIKTSKN